MSNGKRVLVGLSGGVDSAVSAAILLEQGYEVVGGFMKNYVSEKGNCTTFKDAEEAIKVANFLGIELLSFDLQKEYQEKIINYIFDGYSKGITPNPDVLCNSLIKFDVFLNKALELGFDYIATGHYARIESKILKKDNVNINNLNYYDFDKDGQVVYHLLQGVDSWKDQSYFLSGLNQYQLSKSLFPLGGMTKPQVREKAKEIGLPNAERKDSQGLCFIGNVPIRNFLMQRFPEKKGDILDLNGKKVGEHKGAYFYTIGQKQGLGLNFKAYVYRIDIDNNILYVTDKDSNELMTKQMIVKNWHRICEEEGEKELGTNKKIYGKIRYRQIPAVECKLKKISQTEIKVIFEKEQRAVAPGQVFVAYNGEKCLGNGMIM